MNKNLETAFGSYIEPSGDEAIELCKDSGLSAKPVGYVYQETDSFTGHKHLVGAIDKQTLAVGTPLYAHPPTPAKPLNDFDMREVLASSLLCWPRLTESETKNLICFFENVCKYDQQAMELCEVCGWKAKMDGEPCLVCQAPQINKLQAAAQLGLDAFDKMVGRKPEFVEQAIAALRHALK